MGLIKQPTILERFDVSLGGKIDVELVQLCSGPVVVQRFIGEGAVQKSGQVRVGDALLSVASAPIELLRFDAVMANVENAPRPLTLTFGRTERAVLDELKIQRASNLANARQSGEQARLRELEAQRNNEGSHQGAQIRTLQTSKAVYTANDFKSTRLGPATKLAMGLAGLVGLAIGGYIVDVDRFNLLSLGLQKEVVETYEIDAQGTQSVQVTMVQGETAAPTQNLRGATDSAMDAP
mmetsp:Transcript_1030/g.2030  ORF Transcript_1030/g.2030 Transcript_1030/m.2030 type:complete len:237 (-) Transcript_1030:1747-2457(-)|eukprot:CAMPEP_0184515062 /NCGR_PEP_ID=MMETSP0198_2-20121128/4295_1 /TAXON_ID=1112570 /ORGANISM="Thraustochytrium sp., Strain LLF1b" /LENGTH=236 /DNA_ID=CAMNT_0026905291 /DNA_START=405 /DNA_END=1115 /DNA_ORIENTATION=+